ncbi:hypothetical protein GA0111570_103273 [Raineyella antarctica]|uniref:DUF2237 domain-containing protein n=1 Tax=Raineyella antarctica TaxID=1577474 RepID=A0A1G6GHB1_9ACTN|nr:DUF2237 domain-containing protein [Raineyella antarctica]SDB81398.1 hypothetical protein GA0111570_103273 [Raineyella antarctica]
MEARNVLGEPLVPCGTDPVTGFFRDGYCATSPEDVGSHTICALMTAEFLEFQRQTGNNLVDPMPQYGFPGLHPGDPWCVVAPRWVHAYRAGVIAPVVLAATHEAALQYVTLEELAGVAADVPDDISSIGDLP